MKDAVRAYAGLMMTCMVPYIIDAGLHAEEPSGLGYGQPQAP